VTTDEHIRLDHYRDIDYTRYVLWYNTVLGFNLNTRILGLGGGEACKTPMTYTRSLNGFDLFGKQHDDDFFFFINVGGER